MKRSSKKKGKRPQKVHTGLNTFTENFSKKRGKETPFKAVVTKVEKSKITVPDLSQEAIFGSVKKKNKNKKK